MMNKYITLMITLLLGHFISLQAQDSLQLDSSTIEANNHYKVIDMQVASSQKAFKSRKVRRYDLWERIENNCLINTEDVPYEFQMAFKGIAKASQSHIYEMIHGNVKISNQILAPTERQFLQSPYLEPGKSSNKTFECYTGLSYREEEFILSNVDYFALLIENMYYIQDELQYKYHTCGRAYTCKVIKTKEDLKEVMSTPDQLGWVMSIAGGHAIGNFLYIEQEQYNTAEYQMILLKHIDQLKGDIPLRIRSETYLDVPIFSMSLGNWFEDGICGKVVQMSLEEEEVFKKQTSRGEGITALGQEVIKKLTSRGKNGHRILLDVSGMSVKSRDWYYRYIKDQRFRKDSIPIMATNVGISGLPKKDKAYSSDARDKNNKSMFNHRHANLSREDILNVINSRGLIGISLDKNKLMGKLFKERYHAEQKGSAQRRAIATEAIIANVCKIIHTANTIESWDAISISSSFDTHTRFFDEYQKSSDLNRLYKEILKFFKNPRDIPGAYTAKEIKQFMYSFTAEEITKKIMQDNAYQFLYKNLKSRSK